jgi:hypothetical protein
MPGIASTPYFISYFADHMLIKLKLKQENIDISYLLHCFPQLKIDHNAEFIYITACLPADTDFLTHYKIAKLLAQNKKIQKQLDLAIKNL